MPSLHDDLTQHADFVSRLARSLSRPGDDSEAAAQEAMVAALVLPEGSIEEPKAWLAQVVRRSLGRSRRRELRRGEREQLAARPMRSTAPPESQLAEIELGERLLAHVRSLDPVYRDVLFQRYYEHQTPGEIAEASGVSVATVKTRLARALKEMRQRLDADDPRGRAAWLSAAVALGKGGAGVGIGGATKLTSATVKSSGGAAWLGWSAALVAVLIAGLVGLGALSDDDNPLTEDGSLLVEEVARVEPKAAATPLAGVRERIDIVDSPAPQPSPSSVAPPPKAGVQLPMRGLAKAPQRILEPQLWTGFVRDFEGRPLAGATVRGQAKEGEARRPLQTTTDALGYFELGPVTRIEAVEAEYRDWVPMTRPRRTRGDADKFKESTFLMAPMGKLELRASYADGTPVKDLPYILRLNPYTASVSDAFQDDQSKGPDHYAGVPVTLDIPRGVPLTVSVPGGEVDRSVNGTGLTFDDAPGGSPILSSAEEGAFVDVLIRTDVEIRVHVLGPDGLPEPKAKVTLKPRVSRYEVFRSAINLSPDQQSDRVRRLVSVRAEEPLNIQAYLRDEAIPGEAFFDEVDLTVSGRSVMEVTLRLHASSISGIVAGPDGPIGRAIVEFEPLGPSGGETQRVYSGKDGSFFIGTLKSMNYAVSAESRDYGRVTFGTARPGDQPLSLFCTEPLAANVEFKLSMEGREMKSPTLWWDPASDDEDAPATAPPFAEAVFHADLGASFYVAGSDGRLRQVPTRRDGRGSAIRSPIDPGIYRFYVRSAFWEDYGGGRRATYVTGVSDWLEVSPGSHSVAVELGQGGQQSPHAIWEGRIAPARPPVGPQLTAFQRVGVAICDEEGQPLNVSSEGRSPTKFVYCGWQGRVWVDDIPPGSHEVWIGTEAQIQAGRPLARHLVEFPEGTTELTLTY